MAHATEEKKAIELKQKGVIRESTSPWASPIVLVTKKDGGVRPCVDYRKLNQLVKPGGFPLPRIQDCLDSVEGSSLSSTVISGRESGPFYESSKVWSGCRVKESVSDYIKPDISRTDWRWGNAMYYTWLYDWIRPDTVSCSCTTITACNIAIDSETYHSHQPESSADSDCGIFCASAHTSWLSYYQQLL